MNCPGRFKVHQRPRPCQPASMSRVSRPPPELSAARPTDQDTLTAAVQDEDAPPETATETGRCSQELTPSDQPEDCQHRLDRDDREVVHARHDPLDKGNCGQARQECQGKVRTQSGVTEHRLEWLETVSCYKSRVIEINPAYTSQTCRACGHLDKAARKDRRYKCVACGHADHADLNAARNILASGIGATARRGALASATLASREIDAMAA